jgi:SAM-dependent methyltransferase
MPDTYEQSNQALWDEIAPVHARAYEEMTLLREGGIALDEIELREIGEVSGKKMLHLQCHIGTDTLSWARLGAAVTGVDFSAESLAYARKLQQELGLPATFLQSNVYDLRTVLEGQFDIVYTSRGVLCWLRDLEEWGRIVAHFLRPGGTFYIIESHPFAHVMEGTPGGALAITYPYFHAPDPTRWDAGEGDYADATYVTRNPSYEWQWSMGDILNAVIDAGLQIEFLHEYDRLFFKLYPEMVEGPPRWYRLPQYAGKLPLVFTLRAKKG